MIIKTREKIPFASKTEGESMTEQEHKNSCDINKMITAAKRGQMVRGGPRPEYGYDDTTMDGVAFRIKKQELEKSLSETFQNTEFSQKESELIPEKVKKKFKVKTRQEIDKKNDKPNDDKKVEKKPADPEPTTQPSPS